MNGTNEATLKQEDVAKGDNENPNSSDLASESNFKDKIGRERASFDETNGEDKII